ncbi:MULTISPECIES: 2OG-Fe(II) oxygenase [unclassified Beijerinckia]|uniref:2OG-Fe(II) oxygenase n=1 Tax=unclassified Beijerinckia TaxID=2638183 RepID=UPI000898C66D|nr:MULTISPECIES: 2OG-Fe(II) oxygenase [unclassified Beijerinckia]MDH7799945.1 SM-20-related protein [Beijerinckia sp. GAS462]SED43494.1 2OG-Fe(II) oxygenase superfamily protein [Beijerinckia sp. 28-YEA-48]
MTYLDYAALERTPLERDPYDFLIVEDFIRPDTFTQVSADFPDVPGAGSHPPSELKIKGAFAGLMEELEGPQFRKAIEDKFGLELTGRPTMYTVRGYVRDTDGEIHTDSKTKIITVLLYMNQKWDSDGGRLRILRKGDDLESTVAEVPPYGGTLLVFRRSENSWHGHKPFAGPRRAIQLNWVLDQSVVDREQGRHRWSTRLKKVKQAILPQSV